jgi:acetoin:2,6-dichlorophenolindophenol oxidoreductase subunit alpha
VWTVAEAAREAVDAARDGGGPRFIQALTYRFVGHSRSDPGAYRKPGEMDAWRERDPLKVARARMTDELSVAGERFDEVDASVETEIEQIIERGLAASYPTPRPARQFKD